MLILAAPAMAGMVPTLSEAELSIVAENPTLKELGDTSPETLRQVLDLIAAALKEERSGRGGLGSLEREDVEILGRNPALLQVWQSSPEASADLLALIRTAAGGKSQK
jgi:hypothetical protein